MAAMSACDASGGAMIWMGSPERRTSVNTTIETTTIDTIDWRTRPTRKRCTTTLARWRHVFVVRLRWDVGEGRPAPDLPAHRPRDGLHPEHHAVVAVVELLAEVVREPGALVGIELPHGGVDLFVVGAVEEEVEGGLGVDHALPPGHRLVEGRRAVDREGLAGLSQSDLRTEAAGGLGHALDLDADLLPVERDRLHDVRTVLGDELDVGVHAHLEAAGVAGLGEQLPRALGVVGRELPVRAVAAVERIIIVGVGRLAAPPPPEALHDRFLVDGQIEREPHLAPIVQAPGVPGLAGPRARRAIVLAIGRRLARQDDPVLCG